MHQENFIKKDWLLTLNGARGGGVAPLIIDSLFKNNWILYPGKGKKTSTEAYISTFLRQG